MSEIKDRISDVICENRKLKRKLNELIDELNSISAEIGKQDVDILDYSDGYCKGRDEAWECARKINCIHSDGGMSGIELDDIFNMDSNCTIMKYFSASEALEKIKAYEEIKAYEDEHKIRVGDEVKAWYGNAIVTCVNEKAKTANFFYKTGESGCDYLKNIERTGRHFDEIEAMLEKMRE